MIEKKNRKINREFTNGFRIDRSMERDLNKNSHMLCGLVERPQQNKEK